jgi:hypothetical protein
MKLKLIAAAVVALALVVAVPAGAQTQGQSHGTAIQQLKGGGSPPNVVGLKLPVATERLRDAGWAAKPFNTDTLLGVILAPSHYTVCHEYAPVGKSVRLLAQKYGC